ncbi:MAG: BTAD domain-containing putative transcriptional regulator [Rubrivivax sp.]
MDIRLTLLGSPALHAEVETPFGPERRFGFWRCSACAAGQWLARDEIAARFWPEQGNTEARRNLRKVIHRTHAVAGAETLEANDHALRWAVACDVQAFETALKHDRLEEALALRRGVLMAGLDDAANDAYTRWLAEERRRFDAAWRQAAERLLLRTAESAPRIAIAERLLEVDAFDEDALAVALQADLAAGRAAQARQRYDAFAGCLMEALGVEPSRALRDVVRRAARGGAAAGGGRCRIAARFGRSARCARCTCPARRGSFTHPRGVHRPRQQLAEIRLMLARADCRLLTLVGPGGSGKSSLARRVAAGRSALWIELQDLPTAAAALERLAQQLGFDLDERRDAVGVAGAPGCRAAARRARQRRAPRGPGRQRRAAAARAPNAQSAGHLARAAASAGRVAAAARRAGAAR